MTDDAARRFGEYLRDLRTQRKQSVRGLAVAAGIDSGTVTRLEHGEIHAPSPDTLKQLARALKVPLADLFAMAEYVTAGELPDLAPYLNTKFGHLPDETRAAMAQYCTEQASSYDDQSNHPSSIEIKENEQ
ncbi:helix-turn-helix domain-containing protein [Amycolatopsis sp. NPDC101161]|uniref:helix-turn-helix domain-containing protein n=1 Tax=Amycolatopsis sp. NPDC101161 TaxID=3363940 RepID=UPI0037F1B5F0